jgi:hypothetical protein
VPQINFSTSIAASGTLTPLRDWQYRTPPRPSMVELLINASAIGLVMAFTTGPESIVQADTVISAGGTAGTLPSRLNTEPIVDSVLGGEELVLQIRNTTAGAITVNGVVVLTYA